MYKDQGPTMQFSTYYVNKRTSKAKFYQQMDELIDWQGINKIVSRYYTKGKNERGQKAYSGLLLFKMLLVGKWNNLSDYGVEDLVNDSLSANKFCGLDLESSVPDHSVLSRFRSELTQAGAFDKLEKEMERQLAERGVMVKTVTKVDASITDTPRKPRGKKTYEVTDEDTLQEYQKPSVDKEASWVKKGGKLRFGYKKNIITDDNGLVIKTVTTRASTHDSKVFTKLVDKANLDRGCEVQADKAYKSKKHDEFLKSRNLKNGIQHKAQRNKPLSYEQRQINKRISKTRFMVERTFGSMVRWFGAGTARYIGLNKTHTQHVLEGMAYNLKRLPVLFAKQQLLYVG